MGLGPTQGHCVYGKLRLWCPEQESPQQRGGWGRPAFFPLFSSLLLSIREPEFQAPLSISVFDCPPSVTKRIWMRFYLSEGCRTGCAASVLCCVILPHWAEFASILSLSPGKKVVSQRPLGEKTGLVFRVLSIGC